MWSLFDECECAQCGKTFIIPDRGTWLYRKYVYKATSQRKKYFCSYTCMKAFEKDRLNGRSKVPKKHKSETE